MNLSHLARLYATQTRFELLKLLRMRVYTALLLIFPLFLYALSAMNPRVPDIEGIPGAVHLIASFGTFGTFGVALFGFGVGLATERGQGWSTIQRLAPVSPLVPLVARLLACMIFTLIALTVLILGAWFIVDIRLPLATIALLGLTMILSSIPLCAVGLAVGSIVGPNSAPIILMMIYLFVSSISGIIVPLEMIARGNPGVLQIAPLWPPFHAGQLALATVRPAYPGTVPLHIGALVAFTIGFLVIALMMDRLRSSQRFG